MRRSITKSALSLLAAGRKNGVRLPTFLWTLMIAACGGGGGGGGPKITGLEIIETPDVVGIDDKPAGQPAEPAPKTAPKPTITMTITLVKPGLEASSSVETDIRIADIIVTNWPAKKPLAITDLSIPFTIELTSPVIGRPSPPFDLEIKANAQGGFSVFIIAGSGLTAFRGDSIPFTVQLTTPSSHFLMQSAEVKIFEFSLKTDVFENHPFSLPVLETALAGASLVKGVGDNALFNIDKDGRIWFVGVQGYRILDFETAPDQKTGNKNIYELQISYKGAIIPITLEVHDIAYEREFAQRNANSKAHGQTTASESAARADTEIEPLISGNYWRLPESGPLVLTYSLKTRYSPDGLAPNDEVTGQGFEGVQRKSAFRPQDDQGGEIGELPKTDFFHTLAEISHMRRHLREAFGQLERKVNIRFIEVAENRGSVGDIRITLPTKIWESVDDDGVFITTYGLSNFVSTAPNHHNHYLIFKQGSLFNALSSFWLQHELGHALGLKHPWDKIIGWQS